MLYYVTHCYLKSAFVKLSTLTQGEDQKQQRVGKCKSCNR